MKKKKLLILTHNYPSNRFDRQNAGIFVHDFAKELAKKGIKIFVVCPGKNDSKETIEGIIVYWFSWKNKKLGHFNLWNPLDIINFFVFFTRGTKRVFEVYDDVKPDFCLAMWAIPAGIFAFFLKKKNKIDYSIWALGSDVYIYSKIPFFGSFIGKTLREAKYIFADGIDLSQKVNNLSQRKSRFLPSASNFKYRKMGRDFNKGKIVLTFIGRMEKIKGPDILIEALLNIKNEIHNFEINMIGDGSLLKGLKERVKKEGTIKSFNFYGNISDKSKMAKILSRSHWLVIPSRGDSIPLTFSEGMKMGVPVIVSSLPDLKYLVNKYKVGVHFRTGSVSSLNLVFKSLLIKGIDRGRFSKNTRVVADFFSIDKSASQFLKIINL